MTTRHVLHSLRAAWPVLVAGLLLTLTASLYVGSPTGTYWSRVSVYFLAPPDIDNSNTIAFTSDSVIATAGLVAHLVDPGDMAPSTSSDTSLVAEGIKHGVRVRLPNSGGQWAANFNQPMLDAEVVGSDPDAVAADMARVVLEIESTLQDLQADDGVPVDGRITTARTPQDPQVRLATGDAKRSLAMWWLLGGTLSVSAAVAWHSSRNRDGSRPLGRGVAR